MFHFTDSSLRPNDALMYVEEQDQEPDFLTSGVFPWRHIDFPYVVSTEPHLSCSQPLWWKYCSLGNTYKCCFILHFLTHLKKKKEEGIS